MPEHEWTQIDLPTDLEKEHIIALRDTKIALKIFLDNTKDFKDFNKELDETTCATVPTYFSFLGNRIENALYYICILSNAVWITYYNAILISLKLR